MANKWSKKSKANLDTCDPRLQMLFNEVLRLRDCMILEGHRNEEDQSAYYMAGRSRVEWPNGKHNSLPSRAADVVPYPAPDWGDKKAFYHFAGLVHGVAFAMGIPIRWGGDWDGDGDLNDQTFYDLVHFELKE